jgi:hypothetical protein
VRIGSPLIADFSGAGIALSSAHEGVDFDLYGSGDRVRLSWTKEPASARFLVLDRNGNGRIDSGEELFGSSTPGPDGRTLPNGFEALAVYDANGDGFVDRADPIYRELRFWADFDRDGTSDERELASLEDLGVRAIGLAYARHGALDAFGNTFGEQAVLHMMNGETRPIVDVYFADRSK